MKLLVSFIASTFLFSATLGLYPIISTEKTTVQAQEANLNSAEAYYNRGFSYAEQGKYELAIADFNQAIKIDPNNALPYIGRADLYVVQGKNKLARTDLEKAKQLLRVQGDASAVLTEKVDHLLRELP
ncbi:MAG: tetratricopeptide repeat protein [Pleurocapsa minor HA4230-MV1]|nr:tetratricopeptide repeat protein [Pleurocapsa minor HA4230-MV1]